MKILLVEDNDLNRDMLSRRLIKRGFTVLSAVNGKEGIDKAKKYAKDTGKTVDYDYTGPEMKGTKPRKSSRARRNSAY